MRTTYKVGRDARTGRFIPVWVAQEHPNTTVVETYRISTTRSTPRRVTDPPGSGR